MSSDITAATWITSVATVLGPFAAVMIAVQLEPWKARQEQRTRALKTLLTLRQSAYHADFNNTINTIPIDFKGKRKVLQAHKAYIRATTAEGASDDVLNATAAEKLKALIIAMSDCLHYGVDAEMLDAPFYRARGHVDLLNLEIESRKAWIRIADALERQSASVPEALPPR